MLAEEGLAGRVVRLEENTRTAELAARALGTAVGAIVKSLVVIADGRPALAMVSGDRRADLAAVAGLLGAAEVQMARGALVKEITGFAIRFTKAGQMSVSRRTGRTAMIVLPAEPVASFVAPKGDETGLNVIRVAVEADSVRILVNGVRAGAFAANMDTDGIFGFRVGTGTNLHVTRLDKITPLAPPRAPRPATGGN